MDLLNSEKSLYLGQSITGIQILADEDALQIVSDSINLDDTEALVEVSSTASTLLGKSLPIMIPQILELGKAHLEDRKRLKIEYDNLYFLEEEGIHAFEDLAPWAPFVVEVFSQGSLGTTTFRYAYRLYLGTKQIFPEKFGAFVRHDQKIYRLDHLTFVLLRAIDNANTESNNWTSPFGSFVKFADIKGLANEIGVQLDEYLKAERVLIPAEVGLSIDEDKNGRISFVPTVLGIPDPSMKRVFLANDDAQDIYSLDHPDGGRVRVLLGEKQKEAVHRMRRVQGLSGVDKARALSNPAAIFDGVTDVINLEGLGPRVTGIGSFPFVARPFVSSTGVFDPDFSGDPLPKIGIECRYNNGTTERVEFDSLNDCKKFIHEVKVAKEKGEGFVDFKGRTIILDPDFIQGIEIFEGRMISKGKKHEDIKKDDGYYLLIETNEEELDFKEEERPSVPDPFPGLVIPSALFEPDRLKHHQKQGIRWLQRNYGLRAQGRRGCLLADDMGLGKTLQVLNLLAWVIEKGDLAGDDNLHSESAPWNPILVVVPVILLEDRTWLRDIEKFFKYEGSVFQPYLVLHGRELKNLRRMDKSGRETEIGDPVLDLEKIRECRLVLTNYETVVNYQHSLARIKWTVIVTDEAQEYKTPSTKISHALKSLDPRFRVACTGTPVETRLIDVWNIFDFLQPGSLLGSARDFTNNFEKSIEESDENRAEVLRSLKEKLRHGRSDAYILRREKSEVIDLPMKYEHDIYCDLTPLQKDLHRDLVSQMRIGGEYGHHLKFIHNLMFLYQHPDLAVSRDIILTLSTREIIEKCPKLTAVLTMLNGIRAMKEKALVFTRYLVMQQILARVIGETFGLRVDIVNGATKRTPGTKMDNQTRKTIIERFKQNPGFNVIILSPDVAGLGLTLVEANHVIHYGRWWNPAKESQATDRVYRIGQEKEVHVYYPISRDPTGKFITFDEKLDALLKRRRQLAMDFLMPMPGENELGRELIEDILAGEAVPTPKAPSLTIDDVCLLPWEKFEALYALLERKEGRKTILTPLSGDQGIDILSSKNREVRLVQCKHTSFAREVDEITYDELTSAFDGYRARYFGEKDVQLKTVLATNGKFTRKTKEVSSSSGIVLVDAREIQELLTKHQVTYAEIEAVEQTRCKTMRDVINAIQLIV